MHCPECGKKLYARQQGEAIWLYWCKPCDCWYGYNGYIEPPAYECYGSKQPGVEEEIQAT